MKNQKGFSEILLVILIILGIIGAIIVVLGIVGVAVYNNPSVQKSIKTSQSLQKVSQNVPVGNPHWDKAEALFVQIRTEQDPVKYNKIQQEMVTEIKQVLVEQPNNPRVWDELGNAYSWVSGGGDPASAEAGLQAYKKAEALDPKNTVYINGVGDQLILMQKYDDAIIQFQKTLRLTPNSGYANLSLCRAYLGAKVYDSARESCKTAISIFTNENTNGKFDSQILEAKKVMATIPK